MRSALGTGDTFGEFSAVQASYRGRDGRRRPFSLLHELLWSEVRCEPELSDLQKDLMEVITPAGEATWILLRVPDLGGDREAVESALNDLKQRGFVYSTWEQSCEPGDFWGMDNWWAISDAGWELLGVLKSPSYH